MVKAGSSYHDDTVRVLLLGGRKERERERDYELGHVSSSCHLTQITCPQHTRLIKRVITLVNVSSFVTCSLSHTQFRQCCHGGRLLGCQLRSHSSVTRSIQAAATLGSHTLQIPEQCALWRAISRTIISRLPHHLTPTVTIATQHPPIPPSLHPPLFRTC